MGQPDTEGRFGERLKRSRVRVQNPPFSSLFPLRTTKTDGIYPKSAEKNRNSPGIRSLAKADNLFFWRYNFYRLFLWPRSRLFGARRWVARRLLPSAVRRDRERSLCSVDFCSARGSTQQGASESHEKDVEAGRPDSAQTNFFVVLFSLKPEGHPRFSRKDRVQGTGARRSLSSFID